MMLHSTRGVTAQGTGGVKEERDKTLRCDVNREAVIRHAVIRQQQQQMTQVLAKLEDGREVTGGRKGGHARRHICADQQSKLGILRD